MFVHYRLHKIEKLFIRYLRYAQVFVFILTLYKTMIVDFSFFQKVETTTYSFNYDLLVQLRISLFE